MSFDRQAANRRHNKRRYTLGRWVPDRLVKGKLVWQPPTPKKYKPPKRETYKFLDFSRRRERLSQHQITKIFERRTWVVLEWGPKTRPLAGKTIDKVLRALREHPERRKDIMDLLHSTVRPGITYTKPLGADDVDTNGDSNGRK